MSPIVPYATILAHQGGWDEVALVGGPILLIIALLMLAKRRVDAQVARRPAGELPDRQSD